MTKLKWTLTVLLAFGLIFSGQSQVQKKVLQPANGAETFFAPVSYSDQVPKVDPLPPTEAVLYSQMTASTVGISAQDFEAVYDAYDDQGADDFTVTGGPWDINAVRWYGDYSPGGGPADGFHIRFYADNAGSPGTMLYEFLSVGYTEAGGLFIAALPSTVSLADGTYWIDIQCRMDFGVGGQFYWTRVENTAPINNEFHWQNPGDGFGSGNTTWTPASTSTFGAVDNFDLTFELLDAVPQDPILSVVPGTFFDFGNTALGNTAVQTFTLDNIGGGTIDVTDISLDPSSDPEFVITNITPALPASMPPDVVTFDVEFTPNTAGTFNAIVNVSDSWTGVTAINITGKGVIPPANDDCASATPITGPYPQTVSGTTINATADCFSDYTVWYTVDLPYDLNLVTVNFCPTPDVLGTGIYSVYPYLGVDCSCAFYGYDVLDWNMCSTDFAPYYEFWYIPGPVTATLPVTVMDPANNWEMDFQFIIDVQPYISLDLTVFLEGPYAGGGMMATDLNSGGYLPLNQPYNPPLPYYGNPSPVWLYAGTESVAAIPTADVVDWVLVQLRDASSPAQATSATIIGTWPAFVNANGSVTDLDGTSRLMLPILASSIDKGLYAVIYHRNHLGILSNNALTMSGTAFSYDFSSAETQVYGGISGHKELEPGVWGMVAADGNANGLIQNDDKNSVWNVDLGGSGYLGGDFNLNGLTQNDDKNSLWNVNLGGGGQIPAKAGDQSLVESNYGYESQIPD